MANHANCSLNHANCSLNHVTQYSESFISSGGESSKWLAYPPVCRSMWPNRLFHGSASLGSPVQLSISASIHTALGSYQTIKLGATSCQAGQDHYICARVMNVSHLNMSSLRISTECATLSAFEHQASLTLFAKSGINEERRLITNCPWETPCRKRTSRQRDTHNSHKTTLCFAIYFSWYFHTVAHG